MKIIKTMKKLLKFNAIVLFSTTILFMSCSDSNSESETVEEDLSEVVMQDFATTINDIQLPAGLAQSSDPYASQVSFQMQLFKGFTAAFANLFTVPENALAAKKGSKTLSKSATTQTYTWSSEGITFNYKITEESDRYAFAYDIVSQTYTGSYLNGYQLKDGSVAEINFLNNGEDYLKLKWTNLDDVAKMEMNVNGSKLLIESNLNNNSGSMKVYEEGVLTSSFVWNEDGSGSYTDHIENQTFAF